MPIHQPQQRTDVRTDRTGVQQAEAALVEHYPRLVRLAYVVLPPALGRHRRVLTAHAVVQRALPAAGSKASSPRVPAQSRRTGAPEGAEGASADRNPPHSAYGWVRQRVLRAALAHERRPGWWPGRLPAPAALRPALPVVWGLRLFPGRAASTNWPWTGRCRRWTGRSGRRSRCTCWRVWTSPASGSCWPGRGRRIRRVRCAGRPGWGGRTGPGRRRCSGPASSTRARSRPGPAICCGVGTGCGRRRWRRCCAWWRAAWRPPSRRGRGAGARTGLRRGCSRRCSIRRS